MKNQLIAAMLMAAVAAPSAASAQQWGGQHRHFSGDGYRGDYRWQGDQNDNRWDPSQHYRSGGNHRERTLGRNDRIYRGRDGRAYCRRSDGTTGLVIGAVGGGVLGNVVGGGTLGTLLGAGGGALLGRSIDRGNVKCR